MMQDPNDTSTRSRPQSREPAATRSAPQIELEVAEQKPQAALGGVIDTTANDVTIIVSEARLRLVLTENAGSLWALGWLTPLGIFLSLLTTLVASEFKSEQLGLSGSTWHTVFVVATIFAGVWLLAALALRLIRGGRKSAVNDCVKDIKTTTVGGRPELH